MISEKIIDKIESILIHYGQHDPKFKWGETIKYAPYEISEILRRHMRKEN